MENSVLDKLVQEKGRVITDAELKNITVSDKRMEEITNNVNKSFAYDDNMPIPGETVEFDTNDNITKESALNSLYKSATALNAMKKLEAEKAKDKEKAAVTKKQFVDAMLYQQGEMYYEQHHFMMDGATKRRIRKRIEKEYDEGKFTKSGVYFDKITTKRIAKKQKSTKSVSVNDIVALK